MEDDVQERLPQSIIKLLQLSLSLAQFSPSLFFIIFIQNANMKKGKENWQFPFTIIRTGGKGV
jgi:hypothetical protein